MHVAHTNVTAIRINRLVHCDMYRQPYRHELANGMYFLRRSIVSERGHARDVGERCQIERIGEAGMCLAFADQSATFDKSETFAFDGIAERMAKEGHRGSIESYLLHPIGQYTTRTYNKGLVRNTRVSVTGLPTKENH